MLSKIKNTIEKNLAAFIRQLDKSHSLSKISPLLLRSVKEFILRKGKRLRPTLFVLGYLGFARGTAPGLYKSAVSFELLHDFLLIHDDIVDKSATRRGKPTLHRIFDNYLKGEKFTKLSGQDLAIIAGDLLYTKSIEAFLSIKENAARKEKALRKFIEAAGYTEIGEFIELLSGIKDIERITREDIYRIYDYKTARYTFASPLSCGAILAGAGENELSRLEKYGISLGRAFQIKDDILGIFGEERKTGKSGLTDLQEAKKTLPLWYAYKNSGRQGRLAIKRILAKRKVDKTDLLKIRKVISASGALYNVEGEIFALLKKAEFTLRISRMRPVYKQLLQSYSQKLLRL